MSIRPMMDFPSSDSLPDGQPSFRLSCMVALARTHWRMARNAGWPEDIRRAHHTVHGDIAERIQQELDTVPYGSRPNWSAVANELAQEMTTYAMRHAPGSSDGPKEVYMGANIALAAIGGVLIDWAR